MNCPYCGKEMEKGTLRSNGGNYFLPDGQKAFWLRFPTKRYIDKVGAVALPPDPWSTDFWETDWPIAYCCRDCKKIIIEYQYENW